MIEIPAAKQVNIFCIFIRHRAQKLLQKAILKQENVVDYDNYFFNPI